MNWIQMNRNYLIKGTILFFMITLAACASNSEKKDKQHEARSNADVDEILEVKKASQHRGTGPLGSKGNPIKCDGSAGAKSYLEKLKGPKNQPTTFTEIGSGGISPFGGAAVVFEVTIKSIDHPEGQQLYFDTTFENYEEKSAPPGFSLP
jgi:hypothetical protein